MTVRFIKSPSGMPYQLAYFVGDIADIEDAVAADLVDQGIAQKVEETAADKKETAAGARNVEKR